MPVRPIVNRVSRRLTRAGLGLATAAMLATPATAQIVRHANPGPGPSLILQSVTIPAGAETLVLSGQLAAPIDPSKPVTGVESFGDTKTQTVSVFTKIKAILAEHGYTMADVYKLTVFVTADPKRGDGKMDFAGMNDGFKQFFGSADNPNTVARSTVQVAALAGPNYLVEIEATAARMPRR
ncbi:RidA family protein [Sphingomonas sp. CFBP 13714]|uniref:RidA family protein n=1 Tax=Sphingomonas sp. CFBP 13714 TaxID=2775308 RepID=UPI00177CFF0F|nr:RidA family protein [Sphingomonas sp. CFBP 13714]MBD8699591.1 RidA family protein [Sphingomonas sp. CFBP 13714]